MYQYLPISVLSGALDDVLKRGLSQQCGELIAHEASQLKRCLLYFVDKLFPPVQQGDDVFVSLDISTSP